jgi:VanZ family protein
MDGRTLLHRLWIWGPVVAYVIFIFYLSGLSQIPWGEVAPDYLSHALEYCGLAVLVARALNDGLSRAVPTRTLLLAFALCVAYAATDEFHQMFVPNRFADITDVLSDAAGASVGLLAVHFGLRLLVRDPAA